MAGNRRSRMGLLKALTIIYLVWHCFVSLVMAAVAILTLLVSLGIVDGGPDYTGVVTIAGFEIPLPILATIGCVFVGLTIVCGAALVSRSFRSIKFPGSSHGAFVLARALFVICAIGVLWAVSQGSLVLFLALLYSSMLTGLMLLGMKRLEDVEARADVGADSEASRDEVVGRVDQISPEVPLDLSNVSNALRGYATLMIVWGVVKLVMGSMLVMSPNMAAADGATWFGAPLFGTDLGQGALLLMGGLVMLLVGRMGRIAVRTGLRLPRFEHVSWVCLAIACVLLVGGGITYFQAPLCGGLAFFCGITDVALCGAVTFYVRLGMMEAQGSGLQNGATGHDASC